MRYTSACRVTFDAGHQLPEAPHDKEGHGHRYWVTITWEREGYPSTDLIDWMRISRLVDDLRDELVNRDLNKMLGAQVPNVFGVASWFMERLIINVPITQVVVRESNGATAIVERDPHD